MEKISDDNKTKLLEEGRQDVSSKRISKLDVDSKLDKTKTSSKKDKVGDNKSNKNDTFKITFFNPASGENEVVYTKRI